MYEDIIFVSLIKTMELFWVQNVAEKNSIGMTSNS